MMRFQKCGAVAGRSVVGNQMRLWWWIVALSVSTGGLGSSGANGQELPAQALSLKGLDTFHLEAGPIMPEAAAVGMDAASLRRLCDSALAVRGIPLREDAQATISVEIRGFSFGGQLHYSLVLTVSQPVVLVASEQAWRTVTWTERLDGQAEDREFVSLAIRDLNAVCERFATQYRLANGPDAR